MKIKEYLKPRSIHEAYELLREGAVIIGGGAFLNLGEKQFNTALDLSALALKYIKENDSQVEIGAMATLSDIEKSSIVRQNFAGILSKTAASIMGVQLRNMATLGGSIFGKYGFSDIITALLVLDAEIELYKAGRMELESYLDSNMEKDIILKLIIKKNISGAAFACVRKTALDFSILNAAAAIVEGELRVCVGARPGRAKLVKEISLLEYKNQLPQFAEEAAAIACQELQYGSDIRGSAEYRRELCKTLVKRCVMEVLV